MSTNKKKRIVVIGGVAAGTSAASKYGTDMITNDNVCGGYETVSSTH